MGVFDTGCCGADLHTDTVPVVGLLTLSLPLALLLAPAGWVLRVLPGSVGRIGRNATVLSRANADLIYRAAVAPKLRCAVAAQLYPISPRISGAAFRAFNMAVLTSIWAVAISLLGAVLLGGLVAVLA